MLTNQPANVVDPPASTETAGVSTFRLYLLRSFYLLLFVGLAVMIWPGIIRPPSDLPHLKAVVRSVLGAISLLALLGVRYPLKMLPLLFFELVWKSIWLLAFALPRWSAGQLDQTMQGELYDFISTVVLGAVVLPWGYVITQYVRVPGDRWRKRAVPKGMAPAA
jgi:hypothetical protein